MSYESSAEPIKIAELDPDGKRITVEAVLEKVALAMERYVRI